MESSFTTEALFNRTKTIGNVTLVRKVPDDSQKFDYEIHGDIKGDDFLETDADDLPEGSEVMIYSLNPISQSSKEAGLYETLGHEKKIFFTKTKRVCAAGSKTDLICPVIEDG